MVLLRPSVALDYRSKVCHSRSILNDNEIIKYTWRGVFIRLYCCSELDTILKLRKRYFHHKECYAHFLT